jgi:hypothetical protein
MTLWLILLLVWTAGIPTAFLALASFAAWRRGKPQALQVVTCVGATRRHAARSPIADRRSRIARRG